MADCPNLLGATQCLDMGGRHGLLQSGRVHLGFLGAAEVDRYGNLNSTMVKKPDGEIVRLPGSGGACDIAALAHRYVAMIDHEKHRLPENVALSSPLRATATAAPDGAGSRVCPVAAPPP